MKWNEIPKEDVPKYSTIQIATFHYAQEDIKVFLVPVVESPIPGGELYRWVKDAMRKASLYCDNLRTLHEIVTDEYKLNIAAKDKEIEGLKANREFYREATDKCREYVFANKDVGLPCQPLWDAVYDKLTQLTAQRDQYKALAEAAGNVVMQWNSLGKVVREELLHKWQCLKQQIEKPEQRIVEKALQE